MLTAGAATMAMALLPCDAMATTAPQSQALAGVVRPGCQHRGMPMRDYFSAADDTALRVLDNPGGPNPDTFDVVSLKGIDPVVVMAQLEAIMTGSPYEEVSKLGAGPDTPRARRRMNRQTGPRHHGESLRAVASGACAENVPDGYARLISTTNARYCRTAQETRLIAMLAAELAADLGPDIRAAGWAAGSPASR